MQIHQVKSPDLTLEQREQVIALCNAAYGEDVEWLFNTFGPSVHLLGIEQGELVSHVMWVTRWLQPEGCSSLETAYVEMVATAPGRQGEGFATHLMQRLQNEVKKFELAALCPADTSLYARLGWEEWRGGLYIRRGDDLMPTPDERIVIWRLPGTPLDLDTTAKLSAEWRPGELW